MRRLDNLFSDKKYPGNRSALEWRMKLDYWMSNLSIWNEPKWEVQRYITANCVFPCVCVRERENHYKDILQLMIYAAIAYPMYICCNYEAGPLQNLTRCAVLKWPFMFNSCQIYRTVEKYMQRQKKLAVLH